LILTNDPELGKKLDKAVFPGLQGGPLEHVIAAKAVAFGEALRPDFQTYIQQVIRNAQTLAQALQERGFAIISGGTENHLVLVDVRPAGLTGKAADALLGEINVTVNKNTIPFDPQSPFVTSGIRLGTPAMTTRGFREEEFSQVADIIAQRLYHPADGSGRERVAELCSRFPLYSHLPEREPVPV
jgi:glycine hydroxymethyltransferase